MAQTDDQSSWASARVLIVEDDEDISSALGDFLSELGYCVYIETTGVAAQRLLEQRDIDLVLTDVRLPGVNGIDLCHYIAGERPGTPVVVMTAFADAPAAIEALRTGAVDFITKPFETEQLAEVIARTLEQRRLETSVNRLTLPDFLDHTFSDIIGSSPVMVSLKQQVAEAALSEACVVITGEIGTGKELVARSLHKVSSRRNGKFVVVNCRTLPGSVLETELFDYLGATLKSSNESSSLFTEASEGTLFLDEAGDMSMHLQPKLLRALQERSLRGAQPEAPFNARVIAATNQDLARGTQSGVFRINLDPEKGEMNLRVPPLRQRGQDIIELANHFIAQTDTRLDRKLKLTPAAEILLVNYSWPGNVRELASCISAAAATATRHRIDVDDLPKKIRRETSRADSIEIASIEVIERRHVEMVLNAVGWNKVAGARALGIDRATLYRKLIRYGLTGPSDSGRGGFGGIRG